MSAVRLLSAASALFLSACASLGSAAADRADVPMRDVAGRDVGTLTLTTTTGGIMVTGTLRGLPPGPHGIHLHAVGRCEAPFTTAGGHWNPRGKMHGTLNAQGPHLGDMPNIIIGSDSSATIRVQSPGGTLRGSDPLMDADGAAVVIHATADDYRTDPSGNSGSRIACGVVTAP